MNIWSAGLAVELVVTIVLSAAPASGQEKPDSKPLKRYESPKAVFDAYREAYGKRDEGKLFSLLTPNAQNDEVVAAFSGCMEAGGTEGTKERGAILGKYVDATLEDDYYKQYKKKYGIDLKTYSSEYEHGKTPAPPLPRDDRLWFDAEFRGHMTNY